MLNNTLSSTTSKTPNKIAYGFLPRKPLDLISLSSRSNTFVARVDAADAIPFALANQKAHHDKKDQPLFMKIGDWAMLKLHKGYLIPCAVRVTKKLS